MVQVISVGCWNYSQRCDYFTRFFAIVNHSARFRRKMPGSKDVRFPEKRTFRPRGRRRIRHGGALRRTGFEHGRPERRRPSGPDLAQLIDGPDDRLTDGRGDRNHPASGRLAAAGLAEAALEHRRGEVARRRARLAGVNRLRLRWSSVAARHLSLAAFRRAACTRG